MMMSPLYYSIAECFSGDVKLVGGTVPSEGRLEVCIDGHWGTVVDDYFSLFDAVVVCKQLGYYPSCEKQL